MNRKQALQWLVSNVKAWPLSKQVLPVVERPKEWYWVATGGHWKQLICLDGLITHDDWHCAKQPSPLTRDEALAWLVENVKVWPDYNQPEMPPAPSGYFWSSEDYGREINVELFDKKNAINGIGNLEWEKAKQAAQPAPASNNDGWIEHKGGECPVSLDTNIEAILLSGTKLKISPAGYCEWGSCGNGTIIKYRVINDKPVINTNINHVTTGNLSEELNIVTNKYNKPCKGITIDVYDVLKAFEVTCPAMQHAIKKCLMAGKRGSKDAVQDMNEAIQSIERSKELLDQ